MKTDFVKTAPDSVKNRSDSSTLFSGGISPDCSDASASL